MENNWVIKGNSPGFKKWCMNNANISGDYEHYYYYYVDIGNGSGFQNWSWYEYKSNVPSYKKVITLKEYLAMKNGVTDGKIIGYRLKATCNKYRSAALSICNAFANWENSQQKYDISIGQKGYISLLTNAKVFDLWFEPVYEEKFTLPKPKQYLKILDSGGNCCGCNIGDVKQIKEIKTDSCDTNAFFTDGGIFRLKSIGNNFNYEKMWRLATPQEIEDSKIYKIDGYTVLSQRGSVNINGKNYSLQLLKLIKQVLGAPHFDSLKFGCKGQIKVDEKMIDKLISLVKK